MTNESPDRSDRAKREEADIRRLLEFLADKGEKGSIESFAEQYNLDASQLRAFRDGNTYALDPTQLTLMATLIGRAQSGMNGLQDIDDAMAYADPSGSGWYGIFISMEWTRLQKLRTFQHIDQTRPEAHSALTCWADLGVTGNVASDNQYAGGFEPLIFSGTQATRKAFAQDAANINQNIFPDDQKHQCFRGMMKYGDQYGEIGLGDLGGRKVIDRLKPMHARTMMVHRGDALDGSQSYDPNYAYKQVIPGKFEPPMAKFPEWKIAHFANKINWGDIYGMSIFDCELRSWMQIEAMEAGMLVRRLERASQRLKRTVDVGMIHDGDEAIRKYLDDCRLKNQKVKTIDTNRNMRMMRIALPNDQDVWMAKRTKDSPEDVEVLQGDAYIEALGDVHHFMDKWFAGLGPPKSHIGYEDASSKGGINDKHIVWARKVRAVQMKFICGLNKLYWVSMLLRGIDPRSAHYLIWPPSLGTKDEMLRAQVMLAHATTVQYLAKAFGQTGKQPSIMWFMKYIMGFDDEVCETLNIKGMLVKVTDPGQQGAGAGFKNDPPANTKEEEEWEEKANAALRQPEILQQTDNLAFLLEERMIATRSPKMAERLAAEQSRMTKPFSEDFRGVVQSMGITELRAA